MPRPRTFMSYKLCHLKFDNLVATKLQNEPRQYTADGDCWNTFSMLAFKFLSYKTSIVSKSNVLIMDNYSNSNVIL